MYCEHCGAKIKEGSKFCQNCGALVASSAQTNRPEISEVDQFEQMPADEALVYQAVTDHEKEQPKKKNNSVMIIGIAVVAVIAVVAGIVAGMHFMGSTDSDSGNPQVVAVEEEVPEENTIAGDYYFVYDDGSVSDHSYSRVSIIDDDTIEIMSGSIIDGVKQEPIGESITMKKTSDNTYERTETTNVGPYKYIITFKDGSFEHNIIDYFDRDHITEYVKQ